MSFLWTEIYYIKTLEIFLSTSPLTLPLNINRVRVGFTTIVLLCSFFLLLEHFFHHLKNVEEFLFCLFVKRLHFLNVILISFVRQNPWDFFLSYFSLPCELSVVEWEEVTRSIIQFTQLDKTEAIISPFLSHEIASKCGKFLKKDWIDDQIHSMLFSCVKNSLNLNRIINWQLIYLSI